MQESNVIYVIKLSFSIRLMDVQYRIHYNYSSSTPTFLLVFRCTSSMPLWCVVGTLWSRGHRVVVKISTITRQTNTTSVHRFNRMSLCVYIYIIIYNIDGIRNRRKASSCARLRVSCRRNVCKRFSAERLKRERKLQRYCEGIMIIGLKNKLSLRVPRSRT